MPEWGIYINGDINLFFQTKLNLYRTNKLIGFNINNLSLSVELFNILNIQIIIEMYKFLFKVFNKRQTA